MTGKISRICLECPKRMHGHGYTFTKWDEACPLSRTNAQACSCTVPLRNLLTTKIKAATGQKLPLNDVCRVRG